MFKRMPKIALFALPLALFLLACARTALPAPVLSPWSEQYASAKGMVKDLGSDLVLVQAIAYIVRREPGDVGEPIELEVILTFEGLNPTGVTTHDESGYAAQLVEYNDHHLAATLKSGDVYLRPYQPEPASLERASMLQIGPQDALQLTLSEGETYMGQPVNKGNVAIELVWDVSCKFPEFAELNDVLAPAWYIIYYHSGDDKLHILLDAQTGTILKRLERAY